MKKFFLCVALIFIFFSNIKAQEDLHKYATIPDNLLKNANAVVRSSLIEINIEDIDRMVIRKKRIITVLNELGNREIDTYAYYDNDSKISKLSVVVYNESGKQIAKYSKGKFKDISAVDNGTLYSDSRVKFLNYTPTAYPYTLVFESEYKTSSTGFIPSWLPISSYYLSVEKSEYKLYNPKKLEIRTKENNFDNYSIEKTPNNLGFKYVLSTKPAIKYEERSIPFSDFTPNLMVALNNFVLKNIEGKAKNWTEFGKWMYTKLLNDKTELSQKTISKAKELVKDIENPIEKAKILYKFMQNRTRYISVQVGIGGWQPIPADEVDKMGYGDCKGLTNYTKALFDAVGIESYWTLVYAKTRKDIDSEFSSLQGNHMILNIPNNGQDLWLECTSQQAPFGFLGDFTDNRNVLVITPEGGIIKKTPSYNNATNLQTTKANITLSKEGHVNATVEIISKGTQYDEKYTLVSKPEADLKKYYTTNRWSYNNNLSLKDIVLQNDKSQIYFKEKMHVTLNNYASLNENELLLRVNVFNKNTLIPKRYRTRNLPLRIYRGYKDVDNYTITVPNEYHVKQLPTKKEIKTKFGSYTRELIKLDDTNIQYKKTILIKDGTYPKEDYKLYRKFRKQIAKQENLRIAVYKN